ncbi:hypothetical protein ACUUL3_08170 [Thiovibrio sp. JS02]
MKKCSLHDFMEELRPWLDQDHIRSGEVNDAGHFTIHFLDGMKNVYQIDDCNREQILSVLADLKKRGIPVKG